MTPDERLDQQLRSLRDGEILDGPPPEVVSRTLAALHHESSRQPSLSLWERFRSMPPLVRYAAAVVVAATATGLVSLATLGPKGPGVAFADALEQVRAARTVTYHMQIGDDPRL